MKSHHFLFVLILALGSLGTICASAQESDPAANEIKDQNQNQEFNINDDKTLIFEVDLKSKTRDSIHQHAFSPTLKPKSSDQTKPSANKEEDVLSFNFLYYIIQKFKISDLIDDN
jgi:hypothetical protein